MGLTLEIVYGPGRGSQFELKAGLKLGRKKADILLKDQKISSFHAYIEETAQGLVLKDNKSSNGIVVDGKKVPEVLLKAGVIVQLGETYLRVNADEAEKAKGRDAQRPKTWRDLLASWLQENQKNFQSPSGFAVTPFSKLIELEFITGPQLHTKYQIGYGTRRVGRKSLEFPLVGDRIPATCFKLEAGDRGECRFTTSEPDIVKLNSRAVEDQILSDGDVITIFNHTIKVHFISSPKSSR